MVDDSQMTRRDREIAQGMREPGGALIGGLVVMDYAQGHHDYLANTPPPRVTSVSYDLGRRRAAEEAERKADMLVALKAEQERSHAKVRELIAHRPDLLAEYDAKMKELDARHAR